jgi:hypothetical protein
MSTFSISIILISSILILINSNFDYHFYSISIIIISTIPISTIIISTISISTISTLSDLKLDGIATTSSDFADASKNLLTKQNKTKNLFLFLFLYHFLLSICKEVNAAVLKLGVATLKRVAKIFYYIILP